MPATDITQATRYAAPGVLEVVWIPTIAANPPVPTRTEIDAGTSIKCDIAAMAGFTNVAQYIEVPDLCSSIVPKIAGRRTLEDSSIDFYADAAGDDIRDVLTVGGEGYVALMYGGDVEDRLMDIYPVQVAGIAKVADVAGQAAVLLRVSFSVTGTPVEDEDIPAYAP